MRKILAIAVALLAAISVRAGTVTYNFDTDPKGVLEILGNNPEPWQSKGGNPDTGGFLALTYPENNQNSHIIFPDLDPGKVVTAFKFEVDLRIGNSSGGRAADGFSINIARAGDPVLTLKDSDPGRGYAGDTMGGFAGGENGSLPETGTTTGIAISFDTWSGNTLPDASDIEGIIVRVDNKTILRKALATRHGACADATSLQTGPREADFFAGGGDVHTPDAWRTLCWQPFSVELDETGKLTVRWKNTTILDKFQTSYFPSSGRLVLGGRTGGSNENTHFDNIRLTTVAVTPDATAPTVPQNLAVSGTSVTRVALGWSPATDDSGKVAYEIERDGTVITKAPVSGTTFVDTGLKANTTYSYKIRALDPFSNKSAFTTAVTARTATETLVPTPGFLTFEVYTGITGTAIDNLINDPKYPNSPDLVAYATALNTRTVFPDDSNNNYGARLRGFFTPEESGQFEFFLRSDDAAQLFLSPDDKEANLAVIAEETGCCDPFLESGAPETSAPVTLTAGKKYAIQVLLKEGGGGDYAQVAMRKVGAATPAGSLQPISGTLLSTSLDPSHGAPLIKDSPQSASVAAGAAATFNVSALGSAPFTYQWRFKGTDLPNATNATLTVSNVQLVNAGDYDVVVSNFEGSTASARATLSLTGVPTALLVVGSASLNASDAGIKARLESMGLQVISVVAAASQTSDATGKQLIVTSSTVPSGDVGNKFRTVAVPVINWEQALQDNFLMTLETGDTDRGTTDGQTSINIVKADHPLAGGLTAGAKTVTKTGLPYSWGIPNANAVIIATIADDPTHAVIYGYETGAKLSDDTTVAPARRVMFFMGDDAFANLTDDGLKLFDAAVKWAGNLSDKPQTATISVARTATGLTLTFTGKLQSADAITGPWTDVPAAASPFNVTPTGGQKFYRAAR